MPARDARPAPVAVAPLFRLVALPAAHGIRNRGGELKALDARIDRLEEALARLARAQARSEAAFLILTRGVDRLRETLGFTLEEHAREVVRGTSFSTIGSTCRISTAGHFL